MERLLVDTGAWYAYMDQDDQDHAIVASVLEDNATRLLTTDFVIDETLTLLRYRAGRDATVRFGEMAFSGELCRVEHITKPDQQKAWQLFLKYQDHCFSFTDCTSFILMKRLDIHTAVAIDQDFRGFGLLCLPNSH